MPELLPEGSRAARGILKWSTGRLAKEAKVGPQNVIKVERGEEVRDDVVQKLVTTFAIHGVEILGAPQPGARIKKRPA